MCFSAKPIVVLGCGSPQGLLLPTNTSLAMHGLGLDQVRLSFSAATCRINFPACSGGFSTQQQCAHTCVDLAWSVLRLCCLTDSLQSLGFLSPSLESCSRESTCFNIFFGMLAESIASHLDLRCKKDSPVCIHDSQLALSFSLAVNLWKRSWLKNVHKGWLMRSQYQVLFLLPFNSVLISRWPIAISSPKTELWLERC